MSYKVPDIPCKVHEGEVITNLCCLQSCFQALCPECIDDHYKLHQQQGVTAEQDTLKTIINMCEKHLAVGIDGMHEQIWRLEANQKIGPEQIIQEGVAELAPCRQAFHDVIDKHFDDINKKYAERVYADIPKFYDYGELSENMHEILNQLRSLLDTLKTPKLIESASKSARLNVQELVQTYKNQVDAVLGRRLDLPNSVTYNDEKMEKFTNDLNNYIHLKEKTQDNLLLSNVEQMSSQKPKMMSGDVDETNAYFKRKFKPI